MQLTNERRNNGKNISKKSKRRIEINSISVAKKVGISANYYCDIENGNRQQEMKATLLIELSTVLKIPVNSMLEMEKNKKKKED